MSDIDTGVLNTTYCCPVCIGERFIIGPRAGRALNIKCAACGAKWWFAPPFPPRQIDNGDEFYTTAPVVLRTWIHGRLLHMIRSGAEWVDGD